MTTMKTIKNRIITACLGLPLLFCSCANDEKDVFDQSAAQRLNTSVESYRAALVSSENGWLMEYFPGDGTYGGYTYALKFNAQGEVVMWSTMCEYAGLRYDGRSYEADDSVTSLYQVISEQGIVLAFDTYAPMLHTFTEPLGSSDPDGIGGDYEFILQRVSAMQDTIYMKGKRFGNEVRLVRLGEDPQAHIMKAAGKSLIVSSIPQVVKLNVGGEDVTVNMNALEHLAYRDTTGTARSVPYVPTADGFRLFEPISINGVTLQDFVFNPSTNHFHSAEGTAELLYDFPPAEQQITLPPVDEFAFMKSDATFNRLLNGMGQDWTVYIGKNASTVGRPTVPLCIGGRYRVGTVTILPQFGITWTCDQTARTMDIRELGSNRTWFPEYISVMGSVADRVVAFSPYRYEYVMEGPVVSRLKLTSMADPSVWFTIRKARN